MEKKYWKGVEELNSDPEYIRLRDNEFFENLPVDEALSQKAESTSSTSRRDFLKFLGFSVAAASLAACEAPVRKAIPYVIKPEEVTLGYPDYYASTFFDGTDYCSIVVKAREGRPIKIEGNEKSSVTKGGTNARVQASVLSLYDSARLNQPLAGKQPSTWSQVDAEIAPKLSAQSSAGKKIVILTSSLPSPSSKRALGEFMAKYPGSSEVVYDAVSYSGLIKGNELSFGKAIIPSYQFDNASVIVSFGADFLTNWLSPIEFARQYVSNRQLRKGKKEMSRHIQLESFLTLTGSNADQRIKYKPGQQAAAIAALYNKLASKGGASAITAEQSPVDKELDAVAEELWSNKGKALVVCGSNDPNQQVIINAINSMLGSYGKTINLDVACNLRSSNDTAVSAMMSSMNAGEVGAILFWNTNPVYTMPDSKSFQNLLAKVPVKISFADRVDETAQYCDYVCPDHHYLESWNDFEPYAGKYSLAQPVIQPLFKTRQVQETLLHWAGATVTDYHAYLQQTWQNTAYGKQNQITSAEAFWTKSLREGVFESENTPGGSAISFSGNVSAAASALPKSVGGIEVVLYEKTGMGNGNQANNPWLLEFPDPVSKISWDNYFAVLPTFAEKNGWRNGTVIEVETATVKVKGPVLFQPGMPDETLAAAVGYGRSNVGKAGNGVGFNAYPLTAMSNGAIFYTNNVKVNKSVDDDVLFASTQTHHTMMGREIVKETTLKEWKSNPEAGNEPELIESPYGKKTAAELDLWATAKNPDHPRPNHFWGLAIDLNSCIGCGSCVVACQAENNVPVVGKDEVRRSREMHWIRIDRYYSSDVTKSNAKTKGLGKLDMYGEMEKPSLDNPEVVFQPVMCQHCNHAPCETVCPVVATTHSSEGLNMMAYNRCVGTRYCANNCPYKVRRFNWFRYNENPQFPYNMTDDLGKMVLNPDVVVRSRGVMEKCSMCIQRIQFGKLEAKKASRRPIDGEIKTACAQACPTNAIVFGDYNDPESQISELAQDKRNYYLLAEINTKPSVFYQTKVRNREEESKFF